LKLEQADIWSFAGKADALCVTTNGCFRKTGKSPLAGVAVMGAGVALTAARKYPGVTKALAASLMSNGNVPSVINENPVIVSFPTKHGNTIVTAENRKGLLPSYRTAGADGSILPGWMFLSDPRLIEESAKRLAALIEARRWSLVVLPCPGCENGGLSWEDVEKILDRHLDERVLCVVRPEKSRAGAP